MQGKFTALQENGQGIDVCPELELDAQIEPFGPLAQNLQLGTIASVIANVNRGKGKRAFKPSDFAIGFERTDKIDLTKRPTSKTTTIIKDVFGKVKHFVRGSEEYKQMRQKHRRSRSKRK